MQPNDPYGGGEPMLAERRECAESLDDNYAESRRQRSVNPCQQYPTPPGKSVYIKAPSVILLQVKKMFARDAFNEVGTRADR